MNSALRSATLRKDFRHSKVRAQFFISVPISHRLRIMSKFHSRKNRPEVEPTISGDELLPTNSSIPVSSSSISHGQRSRVVNNLHFVKTDWSGTGVYLKHDANVLKTPSLKMQAPLKYTVQNLNCSSTSGNSSAAIPTKLGTIKPSCS